MNFKKHDSLKFLKCSGYNLDVKIQELLEKTKFLSEILRKFICVFIDKNFALKEKFNKNKNKFLHKKKLFDFMRKKINENPILDLALVVLARTWMNESLPDDFSKKMAKCDVFGFEPSPNLLKHLGQKMKFEMALFNLDNATEPFVVFNEEKTNDVNDVCLYLLNGNYGIVYSQSKGEVMFNF